MKTKDFDYHLPKELIAQTPSQRRDFSRLMVLDKEKSTLVHKHFYNIIEYLSEGDTLILNDTRVIPARLFGKRKDTGGGVEILLLNRVEGDKWEIIVRPGKKAKEGALIEFSHLLSGEIVKVKDDGNRIIEFYYHGVFEEILDELGLMPLPPYITESLEDKERYQTVYSKVKGSAAAPTAGLHFTKDLLEQLKNKGINIAYITLHVGLGTFRPVKVDDILDHEMHEEYFVLDQNTADIVNETRARGKKVIAVGTTSVRTLETVASKNGLLRASSGWTDIFIYPSFTFKVVDGILTNFHLPQSTLLMLISAFASREYILKAYEEAVNEKYRFFSFGDAMLIL